MGFLFSAPTPRITPPTYRPTPGGSEERHRAGRGQWAERSVEARRTHERGSPRRRRARIRRQDDGQVEDDQSGDAAMPTGSSTYGFDRHHRIANMERRPGGHARRKAMQKNERSGPAERPTRRGRERTAARRRPAAERSTGSPNRPSSTGVSQLERTAVVGSPGQRRTSSVQRTWADRTEAATRGARQHQR